MRQQLTVAPAPISLLRIRRAARLRGQALVEFALIIPILLVLISGATDVGRGFYFQIAAENTAREAAHWAILTDPSGNALDDNAIFQKVAQPSQESFGISLGLPPQCTSGGTYTDGAPVGACSTGSPLRYASPPVAVSMANPAGGPSLAKGQSWMFIYPGKSGRTAMAPTPANVAWTVSDVRSYAITASDARSRGGIDWARAMAGAFMPAEADAAAPTADCYGFGPPGSLSAWNASLDPANPASLTHTESPNVTVSPTGNPPANDLLLTVSNTLPNLSGSLTQSWVPAGSNSTAAYLNTITGQTSWTPTGTLSIGGSNPPAPGTYTITTTVSTLNKSGSLSATCTQLDQSNTFTLKVFGDPCKTGYTNPGGNPFPTTCNRPIVTSVTASSGSFAGGYTVTISGTNFDATGNGNCAANGKATVQFGTVSAGSLVSCTNTTIVATVPAAPPSTVDVTVTDSNNKISDLNPPADSFTYLCVAAPKPCISGVSPRAETTAGGTSVTITGANFFGGLGSCQVNLATGVNFGAKPATVTSCSDTTLVVTSPAATAGTVDITVTTPGGTSDIGASDAYTYLNAPGAPPPPSTNGPTVHQITVTVIYAFVPVTPGLGLINGQAVVYIVGEATMKATY
jgi:Flp pilus assembly protein TadG